MTRDHKRNPVPNANAARIVAKSTRSTSEAARDLEAEPPAYSGRSPRLEKSPLAYCDSRGKTSFSD